MMKPAPIRPEEALEALRKYCVFQDRSHKEVRSKLLELQVYGDALEEIISTLIREDFLNEERYARSFARGKFQIKKWGRLKIRQHLKAGGVTDYCIDRGMEEIEEEEYGHVLSGIIEQKLRSLRSIEPFERMRKVSAFCLNKGYERDLVFHYVKALLPENEGKQFY